MAEKPKAEASIGYKIYTIPQHNAGAVNFISK